MDGPQSHLASVGRSVWIHLGPSDQNALAETASASDSIYNDESGYSENLTPGRRMVSLLAHDPQASWAAKARRARKPERNAVTPVVCIAAQFPILRHYCEWSSVRLTRHGLVTTNCKPRATPFSLRQQDRFCHACKTATAGMLKFLTQNAHSICVVMRKRRIKSDAMILKSQCSRTFCAIAFIGCKPNPLAVLRFPNSPTARRQLSGVPRDGHAASTNHPASHPARCLAPCPFVVSAIAWNGRCHASQHPRQQLAERPARWRSSVRAATREMGQQLPAKYLARRLAEHPTAKF